MSQVHNALFRGELSASMTRAVGDMRGDSAGLERYGETLTPVIDLWHRPEWEYLRKERLCAYSRTVAAGGAGTTSGIALANPANSGLIVVCEAINIRGASGTATGLYSAPDSTADLGNSSQGFVRDNRVEGGGTIRASQAVIRYSNTPVGLPANHDILEQVEQLDVAYRALIAPPCIVAPGRMLAVYNITTAVFLGAVFKWRERIALPGEL